MCEGGNGLLPTVTQQVTTGFTHKCHKGQVSTRSISDITFVIFVIIFRGVK